MQPVETGRRLAPVRWGGGWGPPQMPRSEPPGCRLHGGPVAGPRTTFLVRGWRARWAAAGGASFSPRAGAGGLRSSWASTSTSPRGNLSRVLFRGHVGTRGGALVTACSFTCPGRRQGGRPAPGSSSRTCRGVVPPGQESKLGSHEWRRNASPLPASLGWLRGVRALLATWLFRAHRAVWVLGTKVQSGAASASPRPRAGPPLVPQRQCPRGPREGTGAVASEHPCPCPHVARPAWQRSGPVCFLRWT